MRKATAVLFVGVVWAWVCGRGAAVNGQTVVPVAGSAAGPGLEDGVRQGAEILRESRESAEGKTKGNLGALRSALSIYYGDMEGRYPAKLEELTPTYLGALPRTSLPLTGHASGSGVVVLTDNVRDEVDLAGRLTDSGRWLYVSNARSPMYGMVIIDCTHKDLKGVPWHKY